MIWNIVSDSSCDLQSRDFSSDRVRFELVPLRIRVGEREFVDNDDLVVPDLLAAMAEEKSASSTACPSPEAFARAFAAGDRTVCFTISANLSGTYNAAVLGREMVLEEHPEKEVCIIDSKSTAGAMVLLIRRARELMEADTTGDFAGICAQLREYHAALRTCFTSIADIIAELSSGITLLPGTIIATGTPAGVGMGFDPPRFLKSGDVIECAIENIGTLRNSVQ